MLQKILRRAFADELKKLAEELQAYPDEAQLWIVSGDIANPAGNLALHQIGSLKYLVGTVLGGTGYVRDRDAEFSRTAVPRSTLLAEIEETAGVVRATLDSLGEEDLDREYPVAEVAPVPITTRTFLVRLAMHAAYHNGQVNYHRRLLASEA
jgi:hypothetical protein